MLLFRPKRAKNIALKKPFIKMAKCGVRFMVQCGWRGRKKQGQNEKNLSVSSGKR